TIYQTAIYGKGGNMAAFAIGVTLAAAILAGGTYTGASLNPARTLGPAIVAGDLSYVLPYFIGMFGGGLFAGVLHTYVLWPIKEYLVSASEIKKRKHLQLPLFLLRSPICAISGWRKDSRRRAKSEYTPVAPDRPPAFAAGSECRASGCRWRRRIPRPMLRSPVRCAARHDRHCEPARRAG